MTAAAVRDDTAVARGARWVTVAFLAVGVFNYAYVLVLTRLLNVGQYATFAAGQGLLLWAVTVATVSVPWVLAQALARARSEQERGAATRFAMLASAGSGLVAALAVGAVAAQFADPLATLALALSTFIIFLGTTPMGWLQGRGRMRTLSLVTVGENLIKNAAGLLLVMVAGLADAGALAAFGIGGLLVLAWWPSVAPGSVRPWRAALANKDLWRRAAGIAGVQGLVMLLAAIDVVVVTMLPAARDTVASYQASAALSRIPLFVASAVATAFFPALSRHGRPEGPPGRDRRKDLGAGGRALATGAVRMYALVAVPLTVILLTMPADVLALVFPPQYAAMATLLKFTAVAGLAFGGINIATTFFQAADDFACLWWQGAGLAGYAAALAAGWLAGGVTGLAVGSALGGVAAFALLAYRLVRSQGASVFRRVPVVAPLVAIGALLATRPLPVLWMAAASVVGAAAAVAFLRRAEPAGGRSTRQAPRRDIGGIP